ncbi:MAG: HigA family addiction module antidote protein [Verrucomicrobia bacterium]|nr:HigA family addiction module antidote protein [Verrucomicrobiota bacterium]MBS0637865.1 HigA family addiction module antidote protein [Verrucomicrobiota bacterium]
MLPKNRPPTHPGEILLEEFLLPLGISQEQLAKHLGGSWTQPKISAIINQKRSITEAIALDFADVFGTTPQFWLNLQVNYDLWYALQEHKKIRRFPRQEAA